MLVLAVRTMPGLDVKNGYVASQAMNGELAAMQEQSVRGWSADASVKYSEGAVPVAIRIRDRAGAPVSGMETSVRLAHPALTRADHAMRLSETAPGYYTGVISGVEPGGWTLVIEAKRDGLRQYVSRNRVTLKE